MNHVHPIFEVPTTFRNNGIVQNTLSIKYLKLSLIPSILQRGAPANNGNPNEMVRSHLGLQYLLCKKICSHLLYFANFHNQSLIKNHIIKH